MLISIVIPIQFIIGVIFFIAYSFLFLFKLLKLKLNFKGIKNIKYEKKSFKNIILVFFKFFFFDLPKKKAFFVFYNLINFIYSTKNKKAFLSLLKNYKLIFKFFKKYIFIYTFKFFTTFSLISVRNTNYIFYKSKIIWYKKWTKFKEFYTNLILNLLIDYNNIQNVIKDYNIIFDSNQKTVTLNPGDLKSIAKQIADSFKEKTLFNLAVNDFRYLSEIDVISYNTSIPMIICNLNLNQSMSLNTALIPKSKISIVDFHKYVYEKYLIQSNPVFQKINQNYTHTISGFKEDTDFSDIIDKNLLKNLNSEKAEDLYLLNSEEFTRVEAHLVQKKSQHLVDASKFIPDFELYSDLKLKLGKDIIYLWNERILMYKLNNNNNLIVDEVDCSLGEYLVQNIHTFEKPLKSAIKSVQDFYEVHGELIKGLSPAAFKNFVDNAYVPDNVGTRFTFYKVVSQENGIPIKNSPEDILLDNLIKKPEKKDCKDIVQDIVNALQNLTK